MRATAVRRRIAEAVAAAWSPTAVRRTALVTGSTSFVIAGALVHTVAGLLAITVVSIVALYAVAPSS